MARGPQITVLSPSPKGFGWGEPVVRPFNNVEAISQLPDQCYAFLHVSDYPPADGRREALLAHFGVPSYVANRTCFELSAYFGSRATYDEESKEEKKPVTSCTTWFRCLAKMVRKVADPHEENPEYVDDPPENGAAPVAGTKGYRWYEMSFFTRWEYPNKCQVLCVDTPWDLPGELHKALDTRDTPLEFRDPFAMHADLMDQVIVYCDIAVWRVRDPVRELEKKRIGIGGIFQPIHDISRHAIHASEVLEAAAETMSDLKKCQTKMHEALPDGDLTITYRQQAKEHVQFQISLVKALKLRSDSSRERLKNEVNLAFNNMSRQDNNVMKSIALLTMIFLPATFFSALFSTTFFTFGDDGGWEVSDKLWIYWATIIPATLGVLIIWGFWLYGPEIRDFLKRHADKFTKGMAKRRKKPAPAAVNKQP
ncbi:hypothetical protein B0T26DRAFT_689624 [Lasiosphaeria miniovina]|uniref:Uncharacterized protein n=1 Tax=Lasiosphaeria miniovina TaxID=1954250 RepID=A0AA40BIE0_9PEZI|nr:uncharacterized protein B0T26DRAFT_689624 [Lasiosphaeria miniovina]KAK0734776.1 hypothetical protein B0T26DRAFT_689624 [Lasiosphaeria miniovina]